MIRFCVVPGNVRSRTDGDWHYVGVRRLANLYCMRIDEYVVHDDNDPAHCRHLPHYYPRADGNYQCVQEPERQKT